MLDSSRIRKDWDALGRAFPERIAEFKAFLKANPTDRNKAVGRLKKLQGDHLKGILQYDITQDDARVWYRVDKRERTVVIKYAGPHP